MTEQEFAEREKSRIKLGCILNLRTKLGQINWLEVKFQLRWNWVEYPIFYPNLSSESASSWWNRLKSDFNPNFWKHLKKIKNISILFKYIQNEFWPIAMNLEVFNLLIDILIKNRLNFFKNRLNLIKNTLKSSRNCLKSIKIWL